MVEQGRPAAKVGSTAARRLAMPAALLLAALSVLLATALIHGNGLAGTHLSLCAPASSIPLAAAAWRSEGAPAAAPAGAPLLASALAPAAAAAPPPPSAEALEAAVVAHYCSAEYRADAAAAVANGTAPALISTGWGCNSIEMCSGAFVSEQLARWRSMPGRYQTLLDMVPCDLFQAIRNRTLWLIGDSNAQRFYKAIECFLRPFLHPPGQNVHDPFTYDPNYRELVQSQLIDGWEGAGVQHPFCVRLLGDTMLCHFRVNHGANLLHTLQNLHVLNARPQRDIVQFNFGLWHNKRRHMDNLYPLPRIYLQPPNAKWVPPLDTGMAQRLADYWKEHRASMPIMIWRDHSPQHFQYEHGEYPHPDQMSKLTNRTCAPLPVELHPDGSISGSDSNVVAGGWRNIVSLPVWRASGIPIMHTWNDTILMDQGHSHAGDCTHSCSPASAYTIWIWSLWRTLEELKLPRL